MRLSETIRRCRDRFFADASKAERPDSRSASAPSQNCRKTIPSPRGGRIAAVSLACVSLVAALVIGTVTSLPVPDVTSRGITFRPPSVSAGRLMATEANSESIPDEQFFEDVVQPFFKIHCYACHDAFYSEAEVNFEAYTSVAAIRKNRHVFSRVIEQLRFGAMPPAEHKPQPPAKLRDRVADWIDHTLNFVDCSTINHPGHVSMRRLNRAEYNNTIRDLIGLDFEPAANFPSDDVGNGFDNQGAVLTLPPLLMEKYFDAAAKIANKAIVTDFGKLLTARKEGGRLSTRGEVEHTFAFTPGKYHLRAEVQADQAGDELAKIGLLLDGKTIKTFAVEGENRPNIFEVTVTIDDDGKQKFAVSFLNDYYDEDAKDAGQRDRNLQINWLEIEGPLGGRPDLPKTHTRIVITTPKTAGTVRAAAEKIFTDFVSRAYRRPAESADVKPLVNLVEMAVNRGESFTQAVAYGVQAVLVSPHFLYRVENDFQQVADNGNAILDDYALASRLSYFLWSSMPDEELFRLAEKGRLSNPRILKEQVLRMLANEKSEALVENFYGQWLNLGRLDAIKPDQGQFPWWNSQLKRSMRTETRLFCAEILRENRPIMDLLEADFTYVNPRLAELYGIQWKGKDPEKLYYAYEGGHPGDYKGNRRSGHYKHENDYVRVSLPDNRKGVLTQASVLTLTSNPGDTSPVKRGQWILTNLLGTPPPPPPPGIPSFDAAKKAKPNATLREQLALHRSDPSCASCHKVMDPLGLAFGHYNVIGKWRKKDGDRPIESSGSIGEGESFSGAIELIEVLRKKHDEKIVRHFVEKLMTYALGRGLQPYDRCAIDEVIAKTRQDDFRIHSVILAIVESDPFLQSRQNRGRTASASTH